MSTPRRALIVIDIQNEYFSGPLSIQHPPIDDALSSILTAIDAAEEAQLPVVLVQHTMGEGAPVFDPSTTGYELHPEIEKRRSENWIHLVKGVASVFADSDLAQQLAELEVDTVTFAGFMTNNCVLGSTVDTERLGLSAEVLSDATGAISIANEAGSADAETVHTTLMALLNSNWASVATVEQWKAAVSAGTPLEGSNLVESALTGAERAR